MLLVVVVVATSFDSAVVAFTLRTPDVAVVAVVAVVVMVVIVLMVVMVVMVVMRTVWIRLHCWLVGQQSSIAVNR